MRRRILLDVTPIRESRQFRLIFGGQLLSGFGNQATAVAVPFQVFHMTHSSLQVGLVSLAQFVPLVLGSIIGGPVGDAVDRRKLLLWSNVAAMLLGLALVANAFAASPSLLVVYIASAASAGVIGFASPARNAVVPLIVPREQLVAAYSINQLTIQIASIAGPLVAGGLIAASGVEAAYLLDVATFAAATLTRIAMEPILPSADAARAGMASFLEGARYVASKPLLIGIYLIDLNAMVLGMPRALFPALAANTFHGGAVALGALYAAPALGALVGATTTGWLHHVERQGRAIVLAVVTWGLAVAAMGITSWLWLALLLLAIAGLADVVSAVLRNTVLQESITDEFRSRTASFQMAVVQGGPRLGDLEAGAVAQLTTPRFSVVSGGLACALGALVVARLIPALARQRKSVPVA